MKASVTYQELQRLVAERTQQPISFEYVDNKTIKVCYEINLGFMKKNVGIDLKVLDIVGSDARVQYSSGFGMDGLVGMALGMVKDKIPEGLVEEEPDRVLKLHLDKIDKMKAMLERIDLKDVNMLTEAVEVIGDFRS